MASDTIPDGEQQAVSEGRRDTSLKANWRVFAITLYLGIALFEYGFDKGAIAGFQAMPGFLQVFGYKTESGEWDIHVCKFCSFSDQLRWNCLLTSLVEMI
jgi:SP family sugar:H+ symporter-like MFS transporter